MASFYNYRVLILKESNKLNSIKEKRIAAFELATLAATSDDNKFKIVANDGLDILTQLALSKDESTREQAVEAINEMLMIPSIQVNHNSCFPFRNFYILTTIIIFLGIVYRKRRYNHYERSSENQ